MVAVEISDYSCRLKLELVGVLFSSSQSLPLKLLFVTFFITQLTHVHYRETNKK